mgnify:CR=1 FL=1
MTQTELLYKDPLAAAEQAASEIAAKTGIPHHDVALVMGSGWVSAVDALGTPVFECNAEEFTGFFAPAVEGHSGKVRSYEIEKDGKKLPSGLDTDLALSELRKKSLGIQGESTSLTIPHCKKSQLILMHLKPQYWLIEVRKKALPFFVVRLVMAHTTAPWNTPRKRTTGWLPISYRGNS